MRTRFQEKRVDAQRKMFDMPEDPVRYIASYVEHPKDTARLRDGMPLATSNEVVCLPTGKHPYETPAPVFRTNPGVEGCGPLTIDSGTCCTRDLQFALSVATIMRTVEHPRPRIPSEMMRWVDGLYANLRPFQFPIVPSDRVQLNYNNDDDRLLWTLSKEQMSRAPTEIHVEGNDVNLGLDLHMIRCPLRIVGVGQNTTLSSYPFAMVFVHTAPIPSLFLDNCTIPNFIALENSELVNAPTPLQVFYTLLRWMMASIPHVRLTLPANTTHLQMETHMINSEGWQAGPQGSPPTYVYPPDTMHGGSNLTLEYDVPNRLVTCRRTT